MQCGCSIQKKAVWWKFDFDPSLQIEMTSRHCKDKMLPCCPQLPSDPSGTLLAFLCFSIFHVSSRKRQWHGFTARRPWVSVTKGVFLGMLWTSHRMCQFLCNVAVRWGCVFLMWSLLLEANISSPSLIEMGLLFDVGCWGACAAWLFHLFYSTLFNSFHLISYTAALMPHGNPGGFHLFPSRPQLRGLERQSVQLWVTFLRDLQWFYPFSWPRKTTGLSKPFFSSFLPQFLAQNKAWLRPSQLCSGAMPPVSRR